MFTACFNYDQPPPQPPANVDQAHIITIGQLQQRFHGQGTSAPLTILDSVFISGRVISSDRDGNIFREMFIQDDYGYGLRIRVGRSGLYNFYRLGQRIYINLQGLTIGNNRGTLELGLRSVNPSFATGFIEVPFLINHHILPGEQEALVLPRTATLPEANSPVTRRVGTLIRIENVTFVEPTGTNPILTWANINLGGSPQSVNQIFRDERGNQFVVRSSGHSRFANDPVPTGPVDIVGVLTVFDNSQMFIRDLNDVVCVNYDKGIQRLPSVIMDIQPEPTPSNIITITYDELNRFASITNMANNLLLEFTHDNYHRPTQIVRRNFTTSEILATHIFTYQENTVYITNYADGTVISTLLLNADGLLLERDFLGQTVRFEHNANGTISRVITNNDTLRLEYGLIRSNFRNVNVPEWFMAYLSQTDIPMVPLNRGGYMISRIYRNNIPDIHFAQMHCRDCINCVERFPGYLEELTLGNRRITFEYILAR